MEPVNNFCQFCLHAICWNFLERSYGWNAPQVNLRTERKCANVSLALQQPGSHDIILSRAMGLLQTAAGSEQSGVKPGCTTSGKHALTGGFYRVCNCSCISALGYRKWVTRLATRKKSWIKSLIIFISTSRFYWTTCFWWISKAQQWK